MEGARLEVLRYLGHKGQPVPEHIDQLIADCMQKVRSVSSPRSVWREFKMKSLPGSVLLPETEAELQGKDIRRHLDGCGSVVVMAATIGGAIEALIRRHERSDLTLSLVLDACATQLIEEHCDTTQKEIAERLSPSGLTSRFSPGYGDFALETQPVILSLLNAQRAIGLTCNQSYILAPRKSVTAVIGVGAGPKARQGGCAKCNLFENCAFRKDEAANGCSAMDGK